MMPKLKSYLQFCFPVMSLFAATAILAAPNKNWNTSEIQFEENKQILWEKYLHDAQNLHELKTEFDKRALKFNDKTMRFSLEKRGTMPEGGYPLYIALHGGGSAPPPLNDSQWEAMKTYYHDSVDQGIYVATRGITNTWKLHWEDDSFPLYDKLIESAILFENVNPNRVYILGFSAGGDGVYQITPRMAPRFAAANMSAGHHNWVKFENLYNTPFALQVGELDAAYNRNRVTAENNNALNQLQNKYHGGYIHDTYIHYNGYHNTWQDNNSARDPETIIANPDDWLKNNNRNTISTNTNAIDWLNQYTRNPEPTQLVWDLNVGADARSYQTGKSLSHQIKLAQPNTLFYWLDVSVAENFPSKGKLVVEALKSTNTIRVIEATNVDRFRVLLNPHLLNLSQPVSVEVGDTYVGKVHVKENSDTMTRTMLERSDKDEIYDAEIILAFNKQKQSWEIENAEKSL